jgi:hypothetical protein
MASRDRPALRRRLRAKGGRGKGQESLLLTLGSPASRLGRREAGGEEFGGGARGYLRGKRRRFRALRADSVGGEEEDGEAVLGVSSKEAGAARNGEGRRRPSSGLAGTHRRKRGASQGEEGRELGFLGAAATFL